MLNDSLDLLRKYIVELPLVINAQATAELTQKASGKWSKKEILGHLIDSSVNNLKRFTEAQVISPYRYQAYLQDQLVRVNRYQNVPMGHLLTLWQSLNTQILYVLEATPREVLATAFIEFDAKDTELRPLSWLVEDYVTHLEHHMKTLV